MNYKAQNGLAPLYLTDLVSPYNTCANSCKDFRLDTQYLWRYSAYSCEDFSDAEYR